MERFLVILLGAVLCVPPAHSVVCYVCDSQTDNVNCILKTSNCSLTNYVCMTVLDTSGIGSGSEVTTITKSCTTQCTPKNYNVVLASYSISCCSKDYCNYSSAERMKTGHAAILLLCFIGALLQSTGL
ncbi:lymphocyte antigen 6E-like [Lissotriton helveticus]